MANKDFKAAEFKAAQAELEAVAGVAAASIAKARELVATGGVLTEEQAMKLLDLQSRLNSAGNVMAGLVAEFAMQATQ